MSCVSVVYPKLTWIEKLACLFLLILEAVKAIMLSTTGGHLPPASEDAEPCAAAAADLQYPLREFRVE